MNKSIQNFGTNFILLGLSDVPHLQIVYFSLVFIVYVITVLVNSLIITVISVNPKLYTPMYFFLCNLSCIDILLSSAIVPKLLANTLSRDKSITFWGCATQVFSLGVLGGTECVILTIMAYDRYIAICQPLRYNKIMNEKFCIHVATGSWSVSIVSAAIHAFFTFQLPFCRSNNINQFFCEMPPLFQLSCKETWFNEIYMYAEAGLYVLICFLLTLISYISIISTIMKISSTGGRYKTFYTCASHLTVVTLFYGNILITYMQPKSSYSPTRDRAFSLFYTVVTPMLNPIIYSIRNTTFMSTLKETFSRKKSLSRHFHG
ncbi:hypothetical protein GDO86_016530 [Hymenochirus boettgeri]|uniref:Olfactory receptor n=1 Tax=Hymenochirus boettgeri TaxID=247094 RepID=A0A8T2K3E4_9PIPI|nr:hypothetical protein GDO86_016530 [Hymenochirus boettgeri]